MADSRDITVTFDDGSTHKYAGTPLSVTPYEVEQRAGREFGRKVLKIDGGEAAPKSTAEKIFGAASYPFRQARGMAEAVTSLATGSVAAPLGGIAGLAAAAVPGLAEGTGRDVSEGISHALTFEPRSPEGKKTLDVVTKPFQALASTADRAGQYVNNETGSPLAATAVNTAIQSIPALAGKVIGKVANSPERAAALAKAQRLNAPFDENLAIANREGLAVSPSDSGAGRIARTVEGMAGEPRLQKALSKANAPRIDKIARRDIGLSEDQPITREAIAEVRKAASEPYEEISQLGRIATDHKYGDQLQGIISQHEGAAKSFPTATVDPVYTLVKELNQATFEGDAAIAKIRLLREDADKAYKTGDKRMGKAYKKAAAAIEDQIDRHLENKLNEQKPAPAAKGAAEFIDGKPRLGSPGAQTLGIESKEVAVHNPEKLARREAEPGEPARVEKDITPQPEAPRITSDLLDRFRAARKLIAKTYMADKALNEATGHIDASKYKQAYKRGTPLDGEALKIAKFNQQFPRASQPAERSMSTAGTYADLLMGGIGGGAFGAAGHALAGDMGATAALMAARPAARGIMGSRPYQNLQAVLHARQYEPGIMAHGEKAGTLAAIMEARDNRRK